MTSSAVMRDVHRRIRHRRYPDPRAGGRCAGGRLGERAVAHHLAYCDLRGGTGYLPEAACERRGGWGGCARVPRGGWCSYSLDHREGGGDGARRVLALREGEGASGSAQPRRLLRVRDGEKSWDGAAVQRRGFRQDRHPCRSSVVIG